MSAQPERGSLAEEATRLLESLQQAAARWGEGGASGGPDDVFGADGASGHASGPCRVCPLCRAVSAVQNVRPETVQHLAEAAVSMAAAVSELVGSVAEEHVSGRSPGGDRVADGGADDGVAGDGATHDGGPDDDSRRRRTDVDRPTRTRDDVQHIDITD